MTEHATLSASGSLRWLECAASVKEEANYPETTSSYAEYGTAGHELAALCLKTSAPGYTSPRDYVGAMLNSVLVDEEMATAVQTYIDYVKAIPGHISVEKKVDFSRWVPDGFGTADAVIIKSYSNFRANSEYTAATIIDLKLGKGIRVDAEDNSQLKLYALGVLNEYAFLDDIETFGLIIVQPRLDHISVWQISRTDLLAWGEIAHDKALLTQHDNPEFNPGEKQCKFCRANANCYSLTNFVVETIKGEFEVHEKANDLTKPFKAVDCNTLTLEEVSMLLSQTKLIRAWTEVLLERALKEALSGIKIPGYKLVEGRSNRKWVDEDITLSFFKKKGIPLKTIVLRNLISITQAEALKGNYYKDKKEFKALIFKPTGKPTLVEEEDKRPELILENSYETIAAELTGEI